MHVDAGATGSCGLNDVPTATPSLVPREVFVSKRLDELLAESMNNTKGLFSE
jgi:hypothetical protein